MIRTSRCLILLLVAACGRGSGGADDGSAAALSDSAFAELQERGASPVAMGVDQYTSAHRFDILPDGGRIELVRDVDDAEGVAQIRSHLRHIASAFAQGDFSIPSFVHNDAEVPGTRVMSEKRDLIRYEFRELPRGGEVLIQTTDGAAIRAVHEFMMFQRGDHRAGGHDGH